MAISETTSSNIARHSALSSGRSASSSGSAAKSSSSSSAGGSSSVSSGASSGSSSGVKNDSSGISDEASEEIGHDDGSDSSHYEALKSNYDEGYNKNKGRTDYSSPEAKEYQETWRGVESAHQDVKNIKAELEQSRKEGRSDAALQGLESRLESAQEKVKSAEQAWNDYTKEHPYGPCTEDNLNDSPISCGNPAVPCDHLFDGAPAAPPDVAAAGNAAPPKEEKAGENQEPYQITAHLSSPQAYHYFQEEDKNLKAIDTELERVKAEGGDTAELEAKRAASEAKKSDLYRQYQTAQLPEAAQAAQSMYRDIDPSCDFSLFGANPTEAEAMAFTGQSLDNALNMWDGRYNQDMAGYMDKAASSNPNDPQAVQKAFAPPPSPPAESSGMQQWMADIDAWRQDIIDTMHCSFGVFGGGGGGGVSDAGVGAAASSGQAQPLSDEYLSALTAYLQEVEAWQNGIIANMHCGFGNLQN